MAHAAPGVGRLGRGLPARTSHHRVTLRHRRQALGFGLRAAGRWADEWERERERGRQDGRQVRDGGTYLDHPVWVSCLETYIGIV